jgi:hypothetical protein
LWNVQENLLAKTAMIRLYPYNIQQKSGRIPFSALWGRRGKALIVRQKAPKKTAAESPTLWASRFTKVVTKLWLPIGKGKRPGQGRELEASFDVKARRCHGEYFDRPWGGNSACRRPLF